MKFDKNMDLEGLLSKLLSPVEKELYNQIDSSFNFPVILQLGAPRSGSTIFTQWAQSTGLFFYPSNFMSRFSSAPYIGALIYEMVTNDKFNYNNEFSDIKSHDRNKFKSEVGKTSGFMSPHEFWYFWRQHFNFSDVPSSNDDFLVKANFDSFNKELSLIHQVFMKPFLINLNSG